MAYTEFYMQTTGSNLNSGSTNADSSSVTETNGDWDNAASQRFTAASGTPFSGVSVGEWASIYNDGASVTPHVAQITAVDGGGTYIEVSATVKYGTKPSAASSGKSCKVGGAWASLVMVASGSALNTGTAPLSTRINVKAGTYANTTTSRTFGLVGAVTAPIEWRGYKTTIGDMDDETLSHGTFASGSDIPVFTSTTGAFVFSGAFQTISHIDFQGAAVSGSLVQPSGAGCWLHRCRIENTAANFNARPIYANGSGGLISSCWLKGTSSASACVYMDSGTPTVIVGTRMIGCIYGIEVTNFVIGIAHACIFDSQVTSATRTGGTSSMMFLFNCTIYDPGGDGMSFPSVPSNAVVAGCIFSECGGYGINNASGTNTPRIKALYNLFHASTSGNNNGFGDWRMLMTQTDSSSPFVSAGTDFTPASGSNAIDNGPPRTFES